MSSSIVTSFDFKRCESLHPAPIAALTYSLLLSVSFVASLYAVPVRIRKLPRDDARQIRWRTLTTFLLGAVGMVTYAFLFCERGTELFFFRVSPYLGLRRDIPAILGVVTHTALLYLGPLFQGFLGLYLAIKDDGNLSLTTFITAWYGFYISPLFYASRSETDRWIRLRNIIVAPVAEELVFRMLMVPAIYSSGLGTFNTVLLAPLFFGVAHVHHAVVSFSNGVPFVKVLLQTMFQLAYTSLFGSYVSYAYLRTGSLLAVIGSHSFCNWMGLPDFSFVNPRSSLHSYSTVLWLVHVAGVVCFALGFSSPLLLPWTGLLQD